MGLFDDVKYLAEVTKEFAEKYPGHAVKNISQVIAELRMQKDGDEVALFPPVTGG